MSHLLLGMVNTFFIKRMFASGFFGPGQLENLKAVIGGMEQPAETAETTSSGGSQPKRPVYISAVFVSTYRLTSKQRSIMEEILEKPVLDRYNIVLQIFKRHARTREAKLQVELAELPYLRYRVGQN